MAVITGEMASARCAGEVQHMEELTRAQQKRFTGSKTDTDDGLGANDTNYRTV